MIKLTYRIKPLKDTHILLFPTQELLDAFVRVNEHVTVQYIEVLS